MTRNVFLLLFMYLFFSCSQKQSQEAKNQYCANQIDLVSASDSLPLIPIQVSTSYDSVLIILEKIENENNIKECSRLLYFGIPFKLNNDSINLRVHISRECHRTELSSSHTPSIKILLNVRGNRLVEEEPTNDDQFIKEILQKHYFNNGVDPRLPDNPKDTFIRLQWDAEVHSDNLQQTIKAIIEGYFLVTEQFSSRVFNKKICNLTEQEKLSSKKEFPLHLELSFDHSHIIPPVLHPFDSSEAEMINIDSTEAEIEN
ncbi:hypothetical protein GXP67_35350 [Rhodocytophaga rosea]|uniref:Lipoprotein n=1 Tax=Rhodocytophaga rosea TaxID=2704465 RepID=A0A6C0GWA1_9BACT|nr:hypothetical protein [Rhodocytophaga rosea]QHT71570.1 hypothetical protein GXP67_35350 [Rhodocytophaga rosea]